MPQAQSLFCRRSCRARQCPKHNLSFAEEVVELATALNQKFSFADEVVELASAPSTISLLPTKLSEGLAEEVVELATAHNQKFSFAEEVVELATALNQKFSFADEVVELASAPSTISLLPTKL